MPGCPCLSQGAYKLPAGLSAPLFPPWNVPIKCMCNVLASGPLFAKIVDPERSSSFPGCPSTSLLTSRLPAHQPSPPALRAKREVWGSQETASLPPLASPTSSYLSLGYLVWKAQAPGQGLCPAPHSVCHTGRCRPLPKPDCSWDTDVGWAAQASASKGANCSLTASNLQT